MNRRRFLKQLLAAPVAMSGLASSQLLFNPLLFKSAHAAEPFNGKTLVVIFQRGGCDGLNVVVPYADPAYYQLRPTIAIAPPGSGQGGAAIDLDGFFGLHPSMAPFHSIFQNQHLAIMPSVHYPDASRSHFDSQQLIENGVPEMMTDGWLNRHLGSQSQDSIIRAVSLGNETAHALRGAAEVVSFNDVSEFSLGENPNLDFLAQAYQQSVSEQQMNRWLLHQQGQIMFDNLEILQTLAEQTYTPANGAVYPDNSYGRQLEQVAQLIKSNVGLQVANIDIGGWDTHSNQGGAEGNQATRMASFASGIEALYRDLGAHMNNVVILTMTEFGRTAAENGSRGTDHGNASCWFAIGYGINGGIYGDWPGLSSGQLYQERYLQHNIQYSDVFAEVLSKHLLNQQLSYVLPDHQYSPIGLIG